MSKCPHAGLSGTAMRAFNSASNPIQDVLKPPAGCIRQTEASWEVEGSMKSDSAQPLRHTHDCTILARSSTVLVAHPASLSPMCSSSDMMSPLRRHSPSLPASITLPYNSESRPKDCDQTFTLSQRLLPKPPEELPVCEEDSPMLLDRSQLRYKDKSVG
jgi:hypothetical protein